MSGITTAIAGAFAFSGGGGPPAFGVETDRIIGAFTASGTTKDFVLTTGIPVGKRVCVVFFNDGNSVSTTSFSDTKGNTYDAVINSTSTPPQASISSAVVTSALVAGDTITATMTGTYSFMFSGLIVLSLDNTTVLDKSGTDSGFGTTTSISLATTAASVLIMGIADNQAVTSSSVDGTQSGAAFSWGSINTGFVIYKNSAASGSVSVGVTVTGASNFRSAAVNYK